MHACIYMLPPTGRDLKPHDLALLKALHSKVNLIPVIAKVDSITREDLEAFKQTVISTLAKNEVKCYMPDLASYVGSFPLGVVASREKVTIAGEAIRVRQYPWGLVEVENPEHSDTAELRDVLFRTHTESLIARTDTLIYEQRRERKLAEMGFSDADADGKPVRLVDTYAAKRQEHLAELDQKDAAIRQRFVQKVNRKEEELNKVKIDLMAKYERLQAIHIEETRRLDAQARAIDAEREQWLEDRAKKGPKVRFARRAAGTAHCASAAATARVCPPK